MTQKLPMLAKTPSEDADLEDYKLHRRFDRMGRLVGDERMKRLMDSHVMIIGLGGVGSFAAESIARSGVGTITIVDFDEICITNGNRQLHALQGLTGKKKSEVMAERLRKINPKADVRSFPIFYEDKTSDEILADKPDYIIDAIDHITSKCFLLNTCRERDIPVVCSTGSGGRMDPTAIQVADLAETTVDRLAKTVRRVLRQEYDFPVGHSGQFGIPAVFSTEAHTEPMELTYDKGLGFRCVCPQGQNEHFTCDNRNMIYGNASFVTGAFGLACASVAVRHIVA